MPTRPILVAESPILNQARNSDLSKKGQTTLTGLFESRPQNSIVRSRDFQVPREDPQGVRVDPAVLTNRTGYLTYLDSLKPYINRTAISAATNQQGGTATTGQGTGVAGGTATTGQGTGVAGGTAAGAAGQQSDPRTGPRGGGRNPIP